MKLNKSIFFFMIPVLVLFAACNGKKEKATTGNDSIAVMPDSTLVHGKHCLQESKSEINITFKDKTYHSVVARTPDESLTNVKDEDGKPFLDNKIDVQLTCGDRTVFHRVFTKSDFSSMVDSSFYARSILEALVFEKTVPQGFVFVASISYPQTDSFIPFTITVDVHGKVSIAKRDMLDDDEVEQ